MALQPSCDKIGNPCKSAVAVEHAKIIYHDWKATHKIQQNNWTGTIFAPHMKNKLRITNTKPFYQRKTLRVVCQLSYDNNGNSCKSAIAVMNSKIIYRYWEATCEIQKNNGTIIHFRPQIENKSRPTELKELNYQRKSGSPAIL